MSDDKKDAGAPGDDADESRAALLQQIEDEISDLTPEELERLYAAIALMELKKDD